MSCDCEPEIMCDMCPNLVHLMDPATCACSCPNEKECPPDSLWDFYSCSCIEEPKPVCEKACMEPWTLDEESCECKCDVYTNCSNGLSFDRKETCSCVQ